MMMNYSMLTNLDSGLFNVALQFRNMVRVRFISRGRSEKELELFKAEMHMMNALCAGRCLPPWTNWLRLQLTFPSQFHKCHQMPRGE